MNAKQIITPQKQFTTQTDSAPHTPVTKKQAPRPVLFEFNDAAARKVCLAGTFNDWKPDGLEMIAMGGGKWAKELLLAPGTYEYRFVVDGKWRPDPAARHAMPNPFGETNSLLIVKEIPNTRDNQAKNHRYEKTEPSVRARPRPPAKRSEQNTFSVEIPAHSRAA